MIFLLGYFIAFIGFFIGYILTLFLVQENLKFTTFLLGLSGGLLISFASFELIPVAIDSGGLWLVLFFMILTIFILAILENKYTFENFNFANNSFFKTSIILAFGIGLHNLPEGFALGSLYNSNPNTFHSFMLVIMLHCIPESIALSIFLIKSFSSLHSNTMHKNIFIIISLLSIPMGIGTFLGNNLYNIFEFIMPISLSIASCAMIYVACGEILPNSKNMGKGVFSVVGSMIGFISGIILVNIF